MESTNSSIEERADTFTRVLNKIIKELKPARYMKCSDDMKGEVTGPHCKEQCPYVLELCNHLSQLYVWSQQWTREKMETLELKSIRLGRENEALKNSRSTLRGNA